MSAEFRVIDLTVPAELQGLRLDIALARLMPEHSRTRIKAWIEAGAVRVGRGAASRPRDPVEAGAHIRVRVSAEPAQAPVEPEAIPLTIVREEREFLVIDKPPGLVVHPGAGNTRHTLQNALLAYDARLVELPRAGLIHRLDKDTSGVLVVARTPEAQTSLSRQLMARTMSREYLAVCAGTVISGGTIDEPIGRHRTDRVRMAVRASGRAAVTHYRIAERFRAHTLVRVKLETGRTHQIRLHLAHIRFPIVGDPVYGGRLLLPRSASAGLIDALRGFKRQALHAESLSFAHPRTGKVVTSSAPVPADFRYLLEALREDARADAPARDGSIE